MEGCHLSCSFYGCKRTYTNSEALNGHLQDHHKIPAQSLPGKSFLCSTIGCEASFSNMQQLMDHGRHHHKPNYFFLCESCRAKLRSYRTLLKHLQTCAKVAKKATKVEPGAAPDVDPSGVPLVPVDMEHPEPLLSPEQMEAQPSLLSNSAALPQPNQQVQQTPNGSSLDPTSIRPPAESMAALEPAKTQNVSGQPDASYSPFPPSLSPVHPAVLPDPSQQEQQQQWTARIGQSSLASSPPLSPPGSNAVWRKNQGQSFSSRILWEHTRGRYSCLQCGHCTPDRKEMTAHIDGQHRSPGGKPNTDTDTVVGSPSPLVKISSDSENSSYTQL
ncbi:zinc finger protein 414 [Colossoma macropomum]|uniref:zinc finger protein 414 n=1 Tax=Colossoma macropomum TaxID=42526 RepID=UPI0018652E6B|nr:zinc finger protein 414 [Colossoma macropomum]XP_036421243.1 zinc finger protein 414 [Colossoma macropomum]XP_036421244.1 zinc finger protein 414 [Colossoma macropomum]XP_036421245.1 zinc finger protein 414 [Colossoma macropomum]XP_036421246.1 zinc finger protein 414 [Colossoma macropomum]